MEEILQLLAMLFERDFEDEWMSLHPSLFCKICLQTLLSVTDNELIVILQWVDCVFIISYESSAWWIWVVDYQISVKCFIIVCDKTQGRLAIGLFNWYIHPKRSKLSYFICVDESVLFCKNTFCACTFFLKFDSPYLSNILKVWK